MVLTGLVRHYALLNNVLDIPNHRSSHSLPTPRGGGLAIVLSYSTAIVWLFVDNRLSLPAITLLGASLLVAAIGFCDDRGGVAARWRFLIHLAASSIAISALDPLPHLLLPSVFQPIATALSESALWLGYPLAVIFLVWSLNLFNFMDGTDGIAASEAVFVSASLGGYLWWIDSSLFAMAISLAVASTGFLIWNWPKAKIFMGDVGSGFIGLSLGLLILLAAQQSPALLYCGLILFGLFIVDASYTLGYRLLSGQQWYAAHCSHSYQHAAKRYNHQTVLLASWAINLGWLLPLSWLVFSQPDYALLGLSLAYLPLLYLAYAFKAGHAEFTS